METLKKLQVFVRQNKDVIIMFLAWVVIINIFFVLAGHRFNLTPDTAYQWICADTLATGDDMTFIQTHSRWDSKWYENIVDSGYVYDKEKILINIVFFPAYPVLIKIVSYLTSNVILSGWLISIVSVFVSLLFFKKLVTKYFPEVNANEAMFFFLIFPSALFLNAVYSEALYIAITLSFFYYLLERKYIVAGILGLLASLTRLTGIFLFLPYAWEVYIALAKNGSKLPLKKYIRSMIPSLLIPLGVFSFFLYHYYKFGDFLLFFKVEQMWGRDFFNLNMSHFILLEGAAQVNFILDMLFAITALVSIYFTYRKVRVSFAIYMMQVIFGALITGTLMSISRYLLVLFPTYILMAKLESPIAKDFLKLLSILLLGFYTILFVNGYWAG